MSRPDTEQFSLRWNNFHSNLTSGFHTLLQEVELVDVTLAAEGQFVQAHKIVLSVCSPYFKQLFQVNPCKHPIVILKDVGHKELVAILQFMYQGEVHVRQEELADFLKTAEMLQIKGLTGNENEQESERKPSTPLPPPSHTPTRSQIRVMDVRSEAHMSETSQSYPPGNDVSMELTSPRNKESTSSIRPLKRLHADPPVSSSAVSHSEEHSVSGFVPKTPKIEPVDIDLDPEITNELPERIPHYLDIRSGDNSQSCHDVSLVSGGTANVTPTISQSQSMRSSSLTHQRQLTEAPLSALQDTSQGVPRYVESTRGKKKLVYGGYVYHLHSDFGSKKYWRCTEYRKGCFGRCTMHENRITSTNIAHNHGQQSQFFLWDSKPFDTNVYPY